MIASTGEIIIRMGAPASQRLSQASSLDIHYGGSETNVLIGLSQMEHRTRLLSRVSEHVMGAKAIQKLRGFGVDTDFVFGGPERMAIYYLEPASGLRGGTIVYDRKHASYNFLLPDEIDWDSFFNGVTWFHWSGITPGLSKNAEEVCRTSIREANKRKITISCDLHFRKNLWDFGVDPRDSIPEMLEMSDHLTADPHTISTMTGIGRLEPGSYLEEDEIIGYFDQVMSEFNGLESMAMLSRKVRSAANQELKGILFNGKATLSREWEISPVIDRIGGGDAFMAGLIHGLHTGMPEQAVIDFATAVAAYKHTIPGDHLEGTMNDFQTIANSSEIDR